MNLTKVTRASTLVRAKMDWFKVRDDLALWNYKNKAERVPTTGCKVATWKKLEIVLNQ